ncbi:bifunctional GMP synthase/glutamine amidotransferase protein, partial [mine drainage metagenome]
SIVRRQPFPGRGLAIRMVGEVTKPRLEILQKADLVVRREVAAAGIEQDMWQWFAVLPGVQSVGVMGDQRTYQEAVVVRAVTSDDGMTADWARIPHDVLQRIASALVSEVAGVNRVLYDITSKPPGTIEWE